MSVVADYNKKYFVIYLHTKFHIPTSKIYYTSPPNFSHHLLISHFNFPPHNTSTKYVHFWNAYYHTLQDSILSAHTSQISASTMLL